MSVWVTSAVPLVATMTFSDDTPEAAALDAGGAVVELYTVTVVVIVLTQLQELVGGVDVVDPGGSGGVGT